MFTVYKHTCPNGKVYIGITKQNPKRRWGVKGQGYKENDHFYRAIQKYGWDNIKHEIIADGLSENEACEMEIDLISKYRATDRSCGYNKHFGGKVHDTISLASLLQANYLPYEEIQKNEVLRTIFSGLINSALGFKYKETETIECFAAGVKVDEQNRDIEREQKPSYFAIYLLLAHYSEAEIIKPLLPRLKQLKSEIEEDI